MMVFNNLWRRRTRTLLTVIGIAVGIASIVSLVALSRGIAENFTEVTSSSAADVTFQPISKEGEAITIGTTMDQDIIEMLRRMPEVKSASGMLYTMVSVPDVPVFIVYGFEPDQVGIDTFKVTEGVTLRDVRTRRGGKPMLLGKIAADKLNKEVGDTLRMEDTTFRIVGIFETGTSMKDSGGVISLQDAQTISDLPHQIMYAGVQLKRPDEVEAFEAKVIKYLPDDVEVAGTQLGSMMGDMLVMLDYFAWGVALIAAVVGGIGMMNTMLMSVFERTREIGVLRAVGWSSGRVMRMILAESLLLSLTGGLLGLGIGAGLAYLAANTTVMQGLTRSEVPTMLIVQSMGTALVLGVIGGAYPARVASKLPPVVALSYDGSTSHKEMKRVPIGGMAVKSLARQRTRTVLTLAGVGVAVISMVLIGSMGKGMIQSFGGMMQGAEISVAEKDQPDTTLSTISERTMKRIEAMPEVRYVNGLIFAVTSTANEPFFVITARDRNDPVLHDNALREGTLINGPRQCLMGWKAAEETGRGVGDRMSMLGTSFTVVGIIQTGTTFDDNGATIDLREAQRLLNKPRQVMSLQIKLHDPERTEEMVARLETEYPDLLFTKSSEFAESLPDMQMTNQMIQGIYVMTIFVGAIALMNTMVMSVHERTREIGVLRSVGWRRRMVLGQILNESLLLTLLSGAVGTGIAVGIILYAQHAPNTGVGGDMFLLSGEIIAQVMAVCVALGLLGGLYPAWRATRYRPVEALRYE